MIQVDIVLAIAIFLSILLTIVFVLWIFYNFHGGKEKTAADSVDQVQQCPYCAYVFVSYEQGDVVMCPRCKSYIAEQAPSPRGASG